MQSQDPNVPPYTVWAGSGISDGFRIMRALEDDNKEEFVKLIRSPMLRFERPPFRLCDLGSFLITMAAVKCAEAVLSGETTGFIDPYFGLPQHGWTALHQASAALCVDLLQLLLDSEKFDPNLRADDQSRSLKQALPLNISLSVLRKLCFLESENSERFDSATLLNILYSQLDLLVEAVRLLALNTREFQQEFFNYAKQGKLVEVAALLLAAGEKLLPLRVSDGVFNSFKWLREHLQDHNTLSAMNHDELAEWKETLKLLDTYDKLGNQLTAYVALKNNRRTGMEVATLLQAEAQGSDAKIVGNCFHEYVDRSNNSSLNILLPQTCIRGELVNGILDKLFHKPNMYPANLLNQEHRKPPLRASSSSLTLARKMCSKHAHVTQPTRGWVYLAKHFATKLIF